MSLLIRYIQSQGNSEVDQDQDGIDDACDGYTWSKPVTPVTSSTVLTESEADVRNEENSPNPEQEEASNNVAQETAPADEIQGSPDEGIVIAESTESGQPTGGSSVENGSLELPAPNRLGLATITIFFTLMALLFGKLKTFMGSISKKSTSIDSSSLST